MRKVSFSGLDLLEGPPLPEMIVEGHVSVPAVFVVHVADPVFGVTWDPRGCVQSLLLSDALVMSLGIDVESPSVYMLL